MSARIDDIRYRAHCVKCHKPLGDGALRVEEPMCYAHRKWELKKEVKHFSTSTCKTNVNARGM